MLEPHFPVADIVLEHAETAPIFARYRIDPCCGGKLPLADACAARGLDVGRVIAELDLAIARRHPHPPNRDPRTLSTRGVIIQLVAPHHQYLHRTLPFLAQVSATVAGIHGHRDRTLHALAQLIAAFAASMTEHMYEEEHVLFPALLAGRAADVQAQLAAMEHEHDVLGAALEDIREAASDFAPPAWACTSYKTLLAELEHLEADTLEHLHVENHVLLPRYLTARAE